MLPTYNVHRTYGYPGGFRFYLRQKDTDPGEVIESREWWDARAEAEEAARLAGAGELKITPVRYAWDMAEAG